MKITKKRIRFSYRYCRVTLVREGRRRWRNYIAGSPGGLGGLSMCSSTSPLFWALMDAIWTIQDETRKPAGGA